MSTSIKRPRRRADDTFMTSLRRAAIYTVTIEAAMETESTFCDLNDAAIVVTRLILIASRRDEPAPQRRDRPTVVTDRRADRYSTMVNRPVNAMR
jgi:hypothetical protein